MLQMTKLDDRLEAKFPETLRQFRAFYFEKLCRKENGDDLNGIVERRNKDKNNS